MRFTKYQRIEFQDTPRKRAAVRRKQLKERESMPLFADQVAKEQIGIDIVMQKRRETWTRIEIRMRARRARLWREGRRQMRGYPESDRCDLMHYWNNHRWLPGDPVYFLGMMHMYDNGRLDLNAPNMLITE